MLPAQVRVRHCGPQVRVAHRFLNEDGALALSEPEALLCAGMPIEVIVSWFEELRERLGN